MSLPVYAAERIITDLGINQINDLFLLDEIAMARGAFVVSGKLAGAEARIAIRHRNAIITLSTSITNPHRCRFNTAHELGHFEMHRQNATVYICTASDLNNWALIKSTPSLEQEANEFAAALLMPEKFFSNICCDLDPSIPAIAQLADEFQVSLTATAIRYSQFCAEAVAVVYSQDGYIKWFRGSKSFADLGLFVDIHGKLDENTLASRSFRGLPVPKKQQQVSATSWLRDGPYSKRATISEQTIAMPILHGTLSLLWVNEELDEEEIW